MEKLIHKLQRSLSHVEKSELNRLEELSQEESVKISLLLSSQPIPTMPDFQLDSKFNGMEGIADVVDDVLGQSTTDLEKSAKDGDDNTYLGKEKPVSGVLSDADALTQCTEWRDTYKVDIGLNWGTLPVELQEKWIETGCDYHLES